MFTSAWSSSPGGQAAPPRARSRRAALRQVASQYRRRRPLPCCCGSWRPHASHAAGSSISAISPPRSYYVLTRRSHV